MRMPLRSAAMMIVSPLRACTGRPLISRLTTFSVIKDLISHRSSRLFGRGGYDAAAMLDIVFELVPEVLHEAADGHRRRIAQRTDRTTLDLARDICESIEISATAPALHDVGQHAI